MGVCPSGKIQETSGKFRGRPRPSQAGAEPLRNTPQAQGCLRSQSSEARGHERLASPHRTVRAQSHRAEATQTAIAPRCACWRGPRRNSLGSTEPSRTSPRPRGSSEAERTGGAGRQSGRDTAPGSPGHGAPLRTEGLGTGSRGSLRGRPSATSATRSLKAQRSLNALLTRFGRASSPSRPPSS